MGSQLIVEKNMSKFGLINLEMRTNKCPKHPLNYQGMRLHFKEALAIGALWLASTFQEVNECNFLIGQILFRGGIRKFIQYKICKNLSK